MEAYEAYCLADPWFYDAPSRTRGDDVDFEAAGRPLPEGWERSESDDWLVYWPPTTDVPPQGWKIHVSACLDNAETILEHVLGYCIPRSIPFKFIRSRQLLLLRNGKYADRGASGKFVTIYPKDESQLETVLNELGQRLEGHSGPYILSDLRWGDGPLFVRYGGFAERYCLGESGQLELAIVDDTGALVPDWRGPTFQPPAWVPLPDCLNEHLVARNNATVADLPYSFESALHFSNGGGLYLGVDQRTGEQVILKEGRPHAGLSTDGMDAVARLGHEAAILQVLGGLDVVPRFRDLLTVGDHQFLVEDFIDGISLNGMIVDRYPLISHEPDPAALAGYTSWAIDVYERVERAVEAIHGRGVVIGDLHPSNILVRPDGQVVLIDFEVASPAEDAKRPMLADPGFMAPPDRTGYDIDLYALACLRLHLFLPLTNLFVIDRAKAGELAEASAEEFPVPLGLMERASRVILGGGGEGSSRRQHRLDADRDGWRRARDSMRTSILASASPHRDDRLFPGDVKQFVSGGLNLAYGAAGVLYALEITGAGRFPEHEEWLAQRAIHPQVGSRLGFYDGLHGVAHVLDRLDHRSEALKVLDIAGAELGDRWDRLGLDLFGGLAGIGLNLLHFATATGDVALSEQAMHVAELVAARLGAADSVDELSGGGRPYAGLLRGSSGPALLFLRMYDQTGDGRWLDAATVALRQDLRRCILRDDGVLEVNEGWRTMPYLADGSIGIGMVLDDFLARREDEELERSLVAIRRAAESAFYIEPGLFYGRAGMILFLVRGLSAGTAGNDPVISSHVRRLAWHGIDYNGALAFPGEQLLRLSMDLATGTAGILLALGAALHEQPVHLPFLGAHRSIQINQSDQHLRIDDQERG